MSELLDLTIPSAVDFLNESIDKPVIEQFIDPSKIEIMLRSAHYPAAPFHATRANEIFESFAREAAKNKIKHYLTFLDNAKVARIDATRWHELTSKIPFTLTTEQVSAINGITAKLNKASPLRGILQGDVGTAYSHEVEHRFALNLNTQTLHASTMVILH